MSRPAGRVLAVDLGKVRIGLAISDPRGVVATPLDTLRIADPDDTDAIVTDVAAVASRQDVAVIVVGLPRALSGREGRPAQRARAVAARLADATDLPVDLWDERFTTVEAERSMLEQGASRRERREAVDRVAATLILQGYLRAHPAAGGGADGLDGTSPPGGR